MTDTSQHIDSWYAASASPHRTFPKLSGEIHSDVCIVGGGYTGLSTAIHLRKLGFSVTYWRLSVRAGALQVVTEGMLVPVNVLIKKVLSAG